VITKPRVHHTVICRLVYGAPLVLQRIRLAAHLLPTLYLSRRARPLSCPFARYGLAGHVVALTAAQGLALMNRLADRHPGLALWPLRLRPEVALLLLGASSGCAIALALASATPASRPLAAAGAGRLRKASARPKRARHGGESGGIGGSISGGIGVGGGGGGRGDRTPRARTVRTVRSAGRGGGGGGRGGCGDLSPDAFSSDVYNDVGGRDDDDDDGSGDEEARVAAPLLGPRIPGGAQQQQGGGLIAKFVEAARRWPERARRAALTGWPQALCFCLALLVHVQVPIPRASAWETRKNNYTKVEKWHWALFLMCWH